MKLVKRLSTKFASSPKPALKDKSKSVPVIKKDQDDADTIKNTSLMTNSFMEESNNSRISLAVNEASIVVGQVEKPTQNTKVGISLQKDESSDTILIASIAEGGLFASTDLKAGQKVLSINSSPCPKDTVKAAKVIAETIGVLTIEAGDLMPQDDQPLLNDEYSLASSTNTEDDYLLDVVDVVNSDEASVNEGEMAPMEVKSDSNPAAADIQPAGSTETDTSRLSLAVLEGTVVIGTVEKPTKDTKVGISLQKDADSNTTLIVSIAEGGLFSATELAVGQKVLSINGSPCPKEPSEAARMIAETVGVLTIEAGDVEKEQPVTIEEKAIIEEQTRDIPSFGEVAASRQSLAVYDGSIVVGTVEKPTTDTKVGISLQKDDDTNTILIVSIADGGLFSATDLRVGQKVLSINESPCPKEPAEAARLISNTTGLLSIEAGDVVRDDTTVEAGESDEDSGEGAEELQAAEAPVADMAVEAAQATPRDLPATPQENNSFFSETVDVAESLKEPLVVDDSILSDVADEPESGDSTREVLASQPAGAALSEDPRVAELEAMIAELELKMSELVGTNGGMKSTMESLEDSVGEKDRSLHNMKAEVEELKSKIAYLDAKLKAISADNDALSASKRALQLEISEKNSKIAGLESTIGDLTHDDDATPNASPAEDVTTTAKDSTIAKLEADLANHDARLEALQDENAALSESKRYLQDAVASKVATIAELEKTVAGLAHEKQGLASKGKEMELAATGNASRIAELELAIVDLASKIATLKGENDSMSASVKNVEGVLASKDSLLKFKAAKIADLENRLARLTGEKLSLFKSKKALEAKLSGRDAKITQLESTIKTLKRQKEEATEETLRNMAAVAAGAVLVGAGFARITFGRR